MGTFWRSRAGNIVAQGHDMPMVQIAGRTGYGGPTGQDNQAK
jgi:hypothetical protein